ncbi:MAG: HAD family hydrolase [Ktedonobacterales bacterium]
MTDPGSFDQNDSADPVIFILDCDNTLFDNDSMKSDLNTQLELLLGKALLEQFWGVYEEVRVLTGTVDFPLTFERYRSYVHDEPTLGQLRSIIMQYPFSDRLYPESLSTLHYLKRLGLPAIVSDGDTICQPYKIAASGLAEEVDWRVLIFIHKEDHLEDIFARWPAPFYVMVDDKQRILADSKAQFPERFVTVHVRQGHYGIALERFSPMPDVTINSIGELRNYRLSDFKRYLKPSTAL